MSHFTNPAASQQVAPLLALPANFLRAGRPTDAIAPLRGAALLPPSNPVIQHDLGLACLVGRPGPSLPVDSETRIALSASVRREHFHFAPAVVPPNVRSCAPPR